MTIQNKKNLQTISIKIITFIIEKRSKTPGISITEKWNVEREYS